MKENSLVREGLRPGAANMRRFRIEPEHMAAAMGNPGVLVFGTPAVLLLAEQTAYSVVAPYLEEGEAAVGARVEIDHLAPALAGASVTCTARLTQIEGRRLLFDIEMQDEHETIARGHYASCVVQLASFMARASAKRDAAPL